MSERGTIDDVVLAQEVIRFMHCSKTKLRFANFKIDMEKAYDKVRWDFSRGCSQ